MYPFGWKFVRYKSIACCISGSVVVVITIFTQLETGISLIVVIAVICHKKEADANISIRTRPDDYPEDYSGAANAALCLYKNFWELHNEKR